jgi:CO/xanthine dehydrogenase Mo-binding subunit
MATILPFLRDPAVFEPETTQAMATAFDEVCRALKLTESAINEREAIASKIVDLARRGERSSRALIERVLRDIGVAATAALPEFPSELTA